MYSETDTTSCEDKGCGTSSDAGERPGVYVLDARHDEVGTETASSESEEQKSFGDEVSDCDVREMGGFTALHD